MTDALTDLIAKLEAATEGSRELDALVAEEVVRNEEYMSVIKDFRYDYAYRYWPGGPSPDYRKVPRYTTSLDAALTLMPEDCISWEVMWSKRRGFSTHVATQKKDGEISGAGIHGQRSASLALCIAALKARLAHD